jgi:ornithine--oxo-acid transaminase
VRGKGFLIGVELREEAGGVRRFCEALKDRGLLCKETHETVIRFAPHLVLKKGELDWAFKNIQEVLMMP